jgi:hypothetical protein
LLKQDTLDIDWVAFNKQLDKRVDVEVSRGALLENVYDKEGYEQIPDQLQAILNQLNAQKIMYESDTFVPLLPKGFLERNNISTKNVLIKILEHPPGTNTWPHMDTYNSAKRKFGLATDAKVKRLWIPCMDYEFGHILCVEKQVVIDYKAGDVFEFPQNIMHSAFNIGINTRIVMTVTGEEVAEAA